VTTEEAAEVTRILALFGLDVYTGEALLAARRFLHFDGTERLLAETPQGVS